MGILRKLFGTEPIATEDGAFSPSKLALKMATSDTTDYDGGAYTSSAQGEKRRVLMVCTEERHMTMANGKKFSTGNHPVEMGLPMLHLLAAGFEIDVVTPTGGSAKIEQWAMPAKDAAVLKLFADFEEALNNPGSLSEFAKTSLTDNSPYAAVYLPGGHGAMLGLPGNHDLGKVLRWAHDKDLYTLAICHGPAALLAAKDDNGFIYDGYEMSVFPDAVDKQTPMIGYMPGHMPWKFGEKLTELGVKIINKKADATCHKDRRLVTGASPQAANDFGRLATTTLLDAS